jgi:hypothetical protein
VQPDLEEDGIAPVSSAFFLLPSQKVMGDSYQSPVV